MRLPPVDRTIQDLCIEMRLSGMTYQAIADTLNAKGIPYKDKTWDAKNTWMICRKIPKPEYRRCIRCPRGTTSRKSKYCATCKDELRSEQLREAGQRAYAKKKSAG